MFLLYYSYGQLDCPELLDNHNHNNKDDGEANSGIWTYGEIVPTSFEGRCPKTLEWVKNSPLLVHHINNYQCVSEFDKILSGNYTNFNCKLYDYSNSVKIIISFL